MAKRVRDATLDNKTARLRLKPRGKPYYRLIERGLHLGYRRLGDKDKGGTWVCRCYVGAQSYQVVSLGIADDYSDADDKKILDFDQATKAARKHMAARVQTGEGTTAAALTVRQVIEDYIAERDARENKRKGRSPHDGKRKGRSDAAQRLCRYVLGRGTIEPAPLAKIELHALDDSDLIGWRADLPDALAAGTRQRLINDLKAALNAGYDRHRKQLPVTVRETVKYGLRAEQHDAEAAPVPDSQVLPDADITKLLRAAQEIDAEEGWAGDLYRLIVVMAATGARYSQVARLRVRDCQPEHSRIMMPDSFKGRKKTADMKPIPVSSDVINILRPVVSGRKPGAWLLEHWRHKRSEGGKGIVWEKDRRGPWSKGEETKPWQAIRDRAGLPDTTAYCLRHSSIVRDLRALLPSMLVAAKHDTSEAIIRRHYGRFIVSDLEQLLASKVVSLVPQDRGGTVLRMRGR